MSNQVIQLPNAERRVCDCCGEESVRLRYDTERFNYKTEHDRIVELSAQVPVWACESCGEQYTDADAEEIRHATVCGYLGRLTPVEIKELRENIGCSQTQFANLTGFGVASVKRWESGSLIQGLAQDRYLRLLRQARNIAALRAMAGIREHAVAKKRAFRTELTADAIAHASVFQLRIKSAVAA
jgi:putative zinc finger/helix-turn-helix YgiT family protein